MVYYISYTIYRIYGIYTYAVYRIYTVYTVFVYTYIHIRIYGIHTVISYINTILYYDIIYINIIMDYNISPSYNICSLVTFSPHFPFKKKVLRSRTRREGCNCSKNITHARHLAQHDNVRTVANYETIKSRGIPFSKRKTSFAIYVIVAPDFWRCNKSMKGFLAASSLIKTWSLYNFIQNCKS